MRNIDHVHALPRPPHHLSFPTQHDLFARYMSFIYLYRIEQCATLRSSLYYLGEAGFPLGLLHPLRRRRPTLQELPEVEGVAEAGDPGGEIGAAEIVGDQRAADG
jgi:hypothetical protein